VKKEKERKHSVTVWEKRLPGIGLCLAIALVAWFVVELLPVLEVMGSAVLAILIGMVGCAVIKNRAAVREGVKDGVAFTSKKVLQYAVILLGFGLNLRQIGQVGLTSLPIILCTISTALIVAFLMSKALHVPGKTATLIGVGSSICGGSAIAATAPVIEADDEEIAQSISVIFLFPGRGHRAVGHGLRPVRGHRGERHLFRHCRRLHLGYPA